MSTRGSGTNPPEDKPKGLAKFRRRVSKILGKDDVKRANIAAASSSAAAAAAAASGKPTDSPTPAKTEPPAAVTSGTVAPQAAAEIKPAPVTLRPKSAMTATENAKIQEEKVRAMFAKYNMTLEIGEWAPPFKADIPRVEKKVRVRVHRTCHRCQTQYGVDRVCSNCNHTRCKKCPRFPAQKKETKGKEPQSGAGYVKRPITQRSRKICHKCQTPFKSKTAQCENCQHERCAQCTRDQPKSANAPGGVAGAPPPLSRTKWTCHECNNVHRDPENPCLKCGHSKCDQCLKEIIKKPGTSSDEGKMKEVEERMKTMGVSSQASAA